MPVPPPSLKGRALRLLATREHSRLELARKLQRFETSPGELNRVLDGLQAKGFIDETRVVASVIHRRAGRLGAGRIRQELQAKGLPVDAIRQAVAGLQVSELQRAREVWRKKFGALGTDEVRRLKQLEIENGRLKKLVAERYLEIEVMKEIAAKKW